jgi:hypothetical protein
MMAAVGSEDGRSLPAPRRRSGRLKSKVAARATLRVVFGPMVWCRGTARAGLSGALGRWAEAVVDGSGGCSALPRESRAVT